MNINCSKPQIGSTRTLNFNASRGFSSLIDAGDPRLSLGNTFAAMGPNAAWHVPLSQREITNKGTNAASQAQLSLSQKKPNYELSSVSVSIDILNITFNYLNQQALLSFSQSSQSFRRLILREMTVSFLDLASLSNAQKIKFVSDNGCKIKINLQNFSFDQTPKELEDFIDNNSKLIPNISILETPFIGCSEKIQKALPNCVSLTSFRFSNFLNNNSGDSVNEPKLFQLPNNLIHLGFAKAENCIFDLPLSLKSLHCGKPSNSMKMQYRKAEEKDLTTLSVDNIILSIPIGLQSFGTYDIYKELTLPDHIIDLSCNGGIKKNATLNLAKLKRFHFSFNKTRIKLPESLEHLSVNKLDGTSSSHIDLSSCENLVTFEIRNCFKEINLLLPENFPKLKKVTISNRDCETPLEILRLQNIALQNSKSED